MKIGASKLPSLSSARISKMSIPVSQSGIVKSLRNVDSMMSLFAYIPEINQQKSVKNVDKIKLAGKDDKSVASSFSIFSKDFIISQKLSIENSENIS